MSISGVSPAEIKEIGLRKVTGDNGQSGWITDSYDDYEAGFTAIALVMLHRVRACGVDHEQAIAILQEDFGWHYPTHGYFSGPLIGKSAVKSIVGLGEGVRKTRFQDCLTTSNFCPRRDEYN